MFYYMHNNNNYQGKICWNKALTFGVGSIQLSFCIYIPLCSPNTCKYVFNPNVTTFQSNCAEGLHFSAFIFSFLMSIKYKFVAALASKTIMIFLSKGGPKGVHAWTPPGSTSVIYTPFLENLMAISREKRRVTTIEVTTKAVEKILSEMRQQNSQYSAISTRKLSLYTLRTNYVRKRSEEQVVHAKIVLASILGRCMFCLECRS